LNPAVDPTGDLLVTGRQPANSIAAATMTNIRLNTSPKADYPAARLSTEWGRTGAAGAGNSELQAADGWATHEVSSSIQDIPSMTVEAPEIIEVDDTRVACDGGGGALGHPLVYLEMGDETFVECPYCDRKFVLRAGVTPH
jgi:uncharacterized Zn-finger protein